MKDDEFFVGYLPVPSRLSRFLTICAVLLVAVFGALSYASGATQDDPGDGRFRFDFGRQTVTGVVELNPYPLIHVTEGSEQIPAGTTLMMSGGGNLTNELASVQHAVRDEDADLAVTGMAMVAMADGEMDATETERLETYSGALGVDQERFDQALEKARAAVAQLFEPKQDGTPAD